MTFASSPGFSPTPTRPVSAKAPRFPSWRRAEDALDIQHCLEEIGLKRLFVASGLDETRDLPYHEGSISRKCVNGMLEFHQAMSLINAAVAYHNLGAVQFSECWRR